MKNVIVLLALCIVSFFGRAQKITAEAIAKLPPDKQAKANELMKQGNAAKITSIAVSAGGGLIALTGLALATSGENDYNYDSNKSEVGAWMFVAGSAIAISSIVFTIIKRTKYNKVKAMLFVEPAVSLSPHLSLPGSQTYGFKIAIPLGK